MPSVDDALVQRSICGHLTEEMTELYSSAGQDEVRSAMEKVVFLAGYREIVLQGERAGGRGEKRGVKAPETEEISDAPKEEAA